MVESGYVILKWYSVEVKPSALFYAKDQTYEKVVMACLKILI